MDVKATLNQPTHLESLACEWAFNRRSDLRQASGVVSVAVLHTASGGGRPGLIPHAHSGGRQWSETVSHT